MVRFSIEALTGDIKARSTEKYEFEQLKNVKLLAFLQNSETHVSIVRK